MIFWVRGFFIFICFSCGPLLAVDRSHKAVVVISLDGVGYKQLEKIDPQFLRDKAVCSTVPPESSFTFPGHQTIATGKRFESSDAQKLDCEKKDGPTDFLCSNSGDKLLVKPMWTKAAELGFDVQTYLWPNASTAWHGIEHHKNKLYPPDQLPKEISSPEVFAIALNALKNWDQKNKFFFMGYSYGLDKVGHATGPFSEKTRARWIELKSEMAQFQKAVGELRQKENKVIEVIFVSDHGMIEVTKEGQTRGQHGIDPAREAAMNGVYWSNPQESSGCPVGMENIAEKIWARYKLKWSVERFGPRESGGIKSPGSAVPENELR